MTKKYTYAVIGSGMQGSAEGYDLAVLGDSKKIYMADQNINAAESACLRINRLSERNVAVPVELDATDVRAVKELLKDADTCCAAAHYKLNPVLTQAAIETQTHFCDLGGNTDVVLEQYKYHELAQKNGIVVIPDCGLAPGLGNILAARSLEMMQCNSIQIRCGGLPQNPKPPLGYHLVFSVSGLTNEYTGMCREIRNGKIVEVPAFTEMEELVFPEPVGRCEAFLTSGGTSTGPDNFLGRVHDFGYKTVRYPGHFEKVRAMIDMGFLDLEPVEIETATIIPRNVFHVLAKNKLAFPGEKDLVVLRVISEGTSKTGSPQRIIQEMMDYYDDRTGYSAMERTTGYAATAVAIMMTKGEIPPGVHPLERVINGDEIIKELSKRKIMIKTSIQDI